MPGRDRAREAAPGYQEKGILSERPRYQLRLCPPAPPFDLASATHSELPAIAQWLKCAPSEVELRVEHVPIDAFADMVRSCEDSFAKFPSEAARTAKIERALRAGAAPWPVFVQDGDPDRFILEGRHRIVAFAWVGYAVVLVACAAVVPDSGRALTRRPAPG